jgi:hypothetical protein
MNEIPFWLGSLRLTVVQGCTGRGSYDLFYKNWQLYSPTPTEFTRWYMLAP